MDVVPAIGVSHTAFIRFHSWCVISLVILLGLIEKQNENMFVSREIDQNVYHNTGIRFVVVVSPVIVECCCHLYGDYF